MDPSLRGVPHSGGLNDDPGHELATGGLYDSSRKVCNIDRQPYPTPWPGTSKESYADADVSGRRQGAEDDDKLPRGSYPVHEDPAASQQHPQEAFRGPTELAAGSPRHGTPPSGRPVEG
ncbi:hypothetical protein GPECTOR_19g348 [Gonium pectorale]|uniref:Uncharacterized protein n=1 Tax=Gonium pectorale TaxID=33097 RepID=A0A150GJA9_GONPE|nr:hypothetical protein GPECTOR_19g348 [Gonium pectorale]|eukprot:KXZ49897.1 hypothetical protein GPECTOR_19g348 [Gonium pectorale]